MSDDGQETQGVKERFGLYQFIIGWVFLIFHLWIDFLRSEKFFVFEI